MNGMKIGKKIEIETLNLKFLTERLEILEGDSRESYIFNLFKVDNVLSEFKKHFDYF